MTRTTTKAISCHVRLRPPHPTDGKFNPEGIKIEGNSIVALNKEGDKKYHFELDKCHAASSTQEEVFESVKPMIEQALNGQNTTIFTYGVTGSGKTHTMQGSALDPGIIPRTVQPLHKGNLPKTIRNAFINVDNCFFEILKDEVYDLLGDQSEPRKRDIRMSSEGQNIIPDLIIQPINSVQEFSEIHNAAAKTRKTASTKLNSSSSRSHAILTLYLEARNNGNPSQVKYGKICLTDLAGSENNNLTGNDKERMRESSAINTSLTTLGKVVDALNINAEKGHTNRGGVFVPYRESKLTRLLQDALGGTSQGLLICCLAPGVKFARDTINTLQFAKKSKSVENRLTIPENTSRRVSAPLPRVTKPLNPNASFKVHAGPRHSAPTAVRVVLSSLSTNTRPVRAVNGRNRLDKENLEGVAVRDREEKVKAMGIKGITDEQLDERIQRIVTHQMEKEKEILITPTDTQGEEIKPVVSGIPEDPNSNINALSPEERDTRARVIVSHARKAHQNGDLPQALSLYRKAYEYVPSNKKLSIRITEIELSLEGILPSLQRDARRSGMKRSHGHLDDLAEVSMESPMKRGRN